MQSALRRSKRGFQQPPLAAFWGFLLFSLQKYRGSGRLTELQRRLLQHGFFCLPDISSEVCRSSLETAQKTLQPSFFIKSYLIRVESNEFSTINSH